MNSDVNVITDDWCNVYGGEWDGGAKRVLGGIGPQVPDRQWFCPTRATARYYMECPHGHRGDLMKLCRKHFWQYRDAVTFCPRCNANDDHKCQIIIREAS